MFTIKTFISKNIIYILGGVAAAALLSSLILGLTAKHYYDAAHDCKTAVITVNASATKTKNIIENRQEKSNAKIGTDTTTRINNALGRLQDSRRKPNLPQTPARSGSLDATSPASELLPVGSLVVNEATYYKDQDICVTNTVVAEGFQAKERADQEIVAEETSGDRTNP